MINSHLIKNDKSVFNSQEMLYNKDVSPFKFYTDNKLKASTEEAEFKN